MEQLKLHKELDNKKLIKYGFKKRKYKGNINYILSIPLYEYKDISVIEAHFIVFQPEQHIRYDVINSSSDTLYVPFYDRKFSNPNKNIELKEVREKLNKELQFMKKSKIISKFLEV